MNHSPSFLIYDASAGSGKTHSLVRAFLTKILGTTNKGSYQNLLAITFTNKAVTEMKQRIVETLVLFSEKDSLSDPPIMMIQIADDTELSLEQLHTKANLVLEHLLHHYSQLSVETIDHFNHRLIRTFARDLKLSSNFEVSLDTVQLISEAVDQLIARAGVDEEITKVLLEFALQKTEEDKSWDVARDINNAAKLLTNENHLVHLRKLKGKSLSDFREFQKKISGRYKTISGAIQTIAENLLSVFNSHELDRSFFSRGSVFDHFTKLSERNFEIEFELVWMKTLGEKPLYPARVKAPHSEIMDGLVPEIITAFEETRALVFESQFLEAILKNLIPLSVVHLVQQELDIIKEEQNLLPISEFNSLINAEIKNQPVPFIYERLGERYRHFFIDEFQDTSLLQWQNLIPLIDNGLSQIDLDEKGGSLLLVGDAKQSIYRWRGGLPEQFIDLSNDMNPFSAEDKKLSTLDTNYRSAAQIVEFNNAFFSFISSYFSDPLHQELYRRGNDQQLNKKEGGYVKLSFIPDDVENDLDKLYANEVLDTISKLVEDGYALGDICILIRSKNDGYALSSTLLEEGIPVVSPDSLLLQNSDLVNAIVSTITLSLYPENEEVKILWLEFLYDHFEITSDRHAFFSGLIKLPLDSLSEELQRHKIEFDFSRLPSLSLYESCEYIIKQLKFSQKADAFVMAFMDLIFEFQQQPKAGKISFLSYWEAQKEKANVPLSENPNSVTLMTIHKAKGLEFPVVLFPYADVSIYRILGDRVWFPLNEDGFEEVLLSFNKKVANFGAVGAQIFSEFQSTQELDNINLLYVALTRAVDRLYVFCKKPKKTPNSTSYFYDFFIKFLEHEQKWDESQLVYEYGSRNKIVSEKKERLLNEKPIKYLSGSPKDSDLNIITTEASLWESETAKALAVGNLLHDTMEDVKTRNDADRVLANIETRGILGGQEFDLLKKLLFQIVNHPDLVNLYETEEMIFTERDILSKEGRSLRPDRLNFHSDQKVTIVDYKTGIPREEHEFQITDYSNALNDMGYDVVKKLLVYSNEEGIVVNKV